MRILFPPIAWLWIKRYFFHQSIMALKYTFETRKRLTNQNWARFIISECTCLLIENDQQCFYSTIRERSFINIKFFARNISFCFVFYLCLLCFNYSTIKRTISLNFAWRCKHQFLYLFSFRFLLLSKHALFMLESLMYIGKHNCILFSYATQVAWDIQATNSFVLFCLFCSAIPHARQTLACYIYNYRNVHCR